MSQNLKNAARNAAKKSGSGPASGKWFWYIARSDELMLDLDHSPGQKLERLRNALARLKGAVVGGKLAVLDAWLYPSHQARHFHMIVRLQNANLLTVIEKYAWEIYLRSDLYRSLNNIMRFCANVSAPALLISDREYPGFYRGPDLTCRCVTKHDIATMRQCPVAIGLRGEDRTRDFFGHPSGKKVKFNFGKIEL